MQILIVEDLADTQLWLTTLAQSVFPSANIVLADSLQQARAQLKKQAWSILLVDIGLPDGSGIDLIADAVKKLPNVAVIVTTIYDDDDNLFQALAAGATGYLLKSQPQAYLAKQLELMKEGHPPMSSTIAKRLINYFQQDKETEDKEIALTQRETEVLTAIAKGMRNREVAHSLGLSLHTVNTYIRDLYSKLNISNRAQAALMAQRRGLL